MKSVKHVKKEFRVLVASPLSIEYKIFINKMLGDDTKIIVFDELESQSVDLIFLTGGADVDPSLYNQRVGSHTHINKKRDQLELKLCTMYGHLPKLGICRGAQFLTALSGGKLIQHVNGHNTAHTIQTGEGMGEDHYKTFTMSSSHHQMMYPFNLNQDQFKLIAWSEYFKSNTYLNGDDKQIKKAETFLEPEIVHYEKFNALCIQGHPEYSTVPEPTVNFVKDLIKTYLL